MALQDMYGNKVQPAVGPNRQGITAPPGSIPAQPFTGRKLPPYYVPYNQYSPVQTSPANSLGDVKKNTKQIYGQLIGTSTNIRNAALADLLQQYNTPMESVFAGQGQDQLAKSLGKATDTLDTEAASRGLVNSGFRSQGLRDIMQQYAEATQANRQNAINQDYTRKQKLLSDILRIPEADLQFYEAIRSGQLPANSLFTDATNTWSQLGLGGGQGLKSIASMGMGGGMGGMGGGGMESFGGGGLQNMNFSSGGWTGQDSFGTMFGGSY